MPKLPIGTIVKLANSPRESVWAVVVDMTYANNWCLRYQQEHEGFVRILEDRRGKSFSTGVALNGGWWISSNYSRSGCEIIPEEEIPEEIIVLAMRCLLDRSFVPFVSEDYKV